MALGAGVHAMTALRRVVVAVGVAGVVAAVLRLRGKGGVPPEDGGWRELHPDELRSG